MTKNKPQAKSHATSQKHAAKVNTAAKSLKDSDYLWSMSHAPSIDKSSHWFQILIITFFTAIIITIVRMVPYKADMDQFYWSRDTGTRADIFSLLKAEFIIFIAILAFTVILYHLVFQMLYVKKSYAYIPMIVYAVFVFLSYVFSDYKEFALMGWNDRFEGTLILLAYMLVLFYVINTVNSEKNVKWILYPLTVTSSLLGLLGISQYFSHDFFTSMIGKKMIIPSKFWSMLDSLVFHFKGGEVYQTVFNPNYVSFYLTLIVPIIAMLFIKEKQIRQKVIWGAVFALLIFNLIGSASSGGILGLGVSFIIALIILNKRLIEWKSSVLVLLVIVLAIGAFTFDRLMPELSGALKGVLNSSEASAPENTDATLSVETSAPLENPAIATSELPAGNLPPLKIDYFETAKDHLTVSIEGELLTITPKFNNNALTLTLKDAAGLEVPLVRDGQSSIMLINDPRFERCTITFAQVDKIPYFILITDSTEWKFAITSDGILYKNASNKFVELGKTPAFGFEDNLKMGTFRGFIWSRSLPLIKDTLLIGHGADTFCIYFPQNDYATLYSIGWDRTIIVDKPHNFYLATAINTGVVSLLAIVVLFLLYLKESFQIYRKLAYTDFLDFVGAGIFIGVAGFLASAFVNDSSVSVMPLFYGLFGTGISINMIQKRRIKTFEQ